MALLTKAARLERFEFNSSTHSSIIYMRVIANKKKINKIFGEWAFIEICAFLFIIQNIKVCVR